MQEGRAVHATMLEIPVIRFSRVEIARNKRARNERSNAVRIQVARSKKK